MVNENMLSKENSFSYTYSAPQRDEVKKIREKYMPKVESPIEKLHRLDESCAQKGTALSLVTGTISALILGVGMCCCMVWGGLLFVLGIVIGMVGLVGVGAAYPIYNKVTQKERQRIAPEILQLTDELLK